MEVNDDQGIKQVLIDAYKQVCRFSNSDVCLQIIRQVEYSEADRRLSFNNAGLSELNFKQLLSALKYILKHEKLSKEVEQLSFRQNTEMSDNELQLLVSVLVKVVDAVVVVVGEDVSVVLDVWLVVGVVVSVGVRVKVVVGVVVGVVHRQSPKSPAW